MIDASARGRLRFTGKNRVDFLHRMSTNDLLKLAIGQGTGTVFTTPIARIIDRTVVYVRPDNVLMLTSRGNQSRVRQWLRKYIFFNDDVQIKDVTDETEMISVYGATANQVISQLTGEDLSVLPLHHWRTVPIAEVAVMIARADPIAGGGFHLIFDRDAKTQVWQALLAAGAVPLSEETYQVLRVEAGQPEFGRELGDEYIPLEANLWNDVSFTKGCYTGQEVVLRATARGHLQRGLVQLALPPSAGPGTPLLAAGQEVGAVTSAIDTPEGRVGLGYLRRAHWKEGERVQAGGAEAVVRRVIVEDGVV